MLTADDTDPPGLGNSPGDKPDSTSATAWLDMISGAEKVYRPYQEKADNIDKLFADLERLANTTRDRQIQLFWANISVMAPSVYSRPPVPVVVPRFKDREELPRTTSEMLERACIVTFEKEEIDGEMKLIRDDLVIQARGAAWLRLEDIAGVKKVCIEQADRKDFLAGPARKWKDVDWVAKRSWLDEDAAKKRFKAYSGDAYKSLQYAVRKDGKSDTENDAQKAGIWELWCKSQNKVVWVSEGCDVVLDQGKPHLTLEGFFPSPRPAYGTVQRRTLIPIPDVLFYKDQLEEINSITARLAALTDAVRVRGFYAAGAGDVSDAIEAAIKSRTDNQIMVPIANVSGLNGVALKDAIAWLPIDMITETITQLIAIRKELINDVYEVTGLSDIMRGQTEASETLGAQQLKSQYGSIRIKDKQDELIRVARDITRMTAEIIAENFDGDTLMEMTQMRLPSDASIEEQAKPLQEQLQKIQQELPAAQQHLAGLQKEIQSAQADPEVQQMAQANPDQAKQIVGAVQQQMQEAQQQVQAAQAQIPALQGQLKALAATVTIDKVLKLLREQKLRPFILDIETDSTIAPDENASKQRATEFVTAVGGYMKEALPLAQTMPKASAVVAETLKFITDQYRAGRGLEGVIDKFADDMEAQAQQPPAPSPEAIKAQADAKAAEAKQQQDAQAAQADNQAKGAQAAKDTAEAQATAAESQTRTADAEVKRKIEVQRELDASDTKAAERHAKLLESQSTAQAKLIEAQTAAADAETKRKIDEQREIDASAARAVELESKKVLAALAITAAREKHEQEMAKGAQAMELAAAKHTRDQEAADAQEARDAAAAQNSAQSEGNK